MKKLLIGAGALAVVVALLYFVFPAQFTIFGGLVRSAILGADEPAGTTQTETNPDFKSPATGVSPATHPINPDFARLNLGSEAGTVATEANPDFKGVAHVAALETPAGADWPSYNRTLTSERFSHLRQIDTTNVKDLKVLCTYDTKQVTSFETAPIMVNGALIATTEFDIFSLDPATCSENWRVHEDYPPSLLSVNRGAAYLDDRLFRGTQDGRVLAYDFKTGKRLWETKIADMKKGESIPSAPIAWNGLVFIGNAGGDYKGVKGRMYALDAATGKVVWEFYLVPRQEGDPTLGPQGKSPLDTATWGNAPGTPISGGGTWTSYTLDPTKGLLYVPGGNPAPDFALGVREGENLYSGSVVVLDAKTGDYKDHIKIVPEDWHDWDVSNPPALYQSRGGKQLLSIAPKDGHLYGFDRTANKMLYRVPVTQIENVEAPFEVGKSVHFCPGAVGGAEWNSPAYDPTTNLVLIGEVEWCTSVELQTEEKIVGSADAQPWTGMAALNPVNAFGRVDHADGHWAGWVYAVDADTGTWKWRLKSNYPVVSGMTPTAGGVAFLGDVGGHFYALDAATGDKLWGQKLDGAIGGGVITYTAQDGNQKVAAAIGFTSIMWPTQLTTGKIVVLGVNSATAN